MFSFMQGKQLPAKSSQQVSLDEILAAGVGGKPDVGVMASRNDGNIAIMVWHYHDDDVPGPDAAIELTIAGARRASAAVTHYRIDQQHSNSYAAWQRLGSPIAPDKPTYDTLRAAGQLTKLEDGAMQVKKAGDSLQVTFTLPRQGVSLLLVPLSPR
jgi:xylan 1,4-beta-xylosidase